MSQKLGVIIVSGILLILLVFILIISFRPRPEEVPEGEPPVVEEVVTPPSSPTPVAQSTEVSPIPTPVADMEESTPVSVLPTPTTAATVSASASSNLNLRGGPGTNFPVVGSLPAGSSVTVVGRNEDGSWLVIETASSTAWLTSDADLVELEGGQLDSLPVVQAPILPYNVNNPQVTQLLNEIPHNPSSFTCVSHAGINNLDPLRAGNVIGPHAGDFVYNTDNVLFKYQNGSLQLIKENPIARFENGAESLPFDKAMQLLERGEIIWTGRLGESPGRGVTGCDPLVK